MKKKFLLITLFFILFSTPGFAAENTSTEATPAGSNRRVENLDTEDSINPIFIKRKDPFLAGLYSFLMMGAGQFYTGNYEKGSLLLFSDVMLKAVLVGLVLHIKSEYTSDTKTSVYWRDLNATDKTIVLGYSVLYLAILVINIHDAVQSANEYNRRYLRGSSFQVGLNGGPKSFSIVLSTRF